MPSLKSSTLIIGTSEAPHLSFGPDCALTVREASRNFLSDSYDVVAVPLLSALSEEFKKSYQDFKQKNLFSQLVLIAPQKSDPNDLKSALNFFPVFRISEDFKDPQFESHLMAALEQAQTIKQDSQLESLVREQNEKLKSLYQDLEVRVDKRQNFLLEARRKNYVAQSRWESTREAMMAIHQASSLGEIESHLLQVLQSSLELQSLRVFFRPQDQYFSKQNQTHNSFAFFQAPLFRDQEQIGSLFFLRAKGKTFQRDETDFLLRITEAVSLALDRLSKLDQSEMLKEQWQATFNAISDPVSIINDKYEIIQTNQAFLEKTGLSQDKVTASKCYQVLFGREAPCVHCNLGSNFRIETQKPKGSSFDVYSHKMQADPLGKKTFVNLYHDMTEQLKMERKILESAKLAELGTIGSSIAHELNNPLGGVLSFVQLIKMDLKKDDPLYEDIVSMEEGVNRCKEIIQNLLGFTRDPSVDEEIDLDLKDVIGRAMKIVELQTKSRGIEVKTFLPKDSAPFRGHLNLLSQAVRNILQTSIDALIENKGSHGVIEIRLEAKANDYQIQIIDNGLGSDLSTNLSLSVAGQIIHDHGGNLELFTQAKPLRLAKISLPRPVFQN